MMFSAPFAVNALLAHISCFLADDSWIIVVASVTSIVLSTLHYTRLETLQLKSHWTRCMRENDEETEDILLQQDRAISTDCEAEEYWLDLCARNWRYEDYDDIAPRAWEWFRGNDHHAPLHSLRLSSR